jgi:putative transposase
MSRKINKAYKYRLVPNEEQLDKLNRMVGCSRFVYNHFLQLNKDQYEKDQTFVFTHEMVTMLPKLKEEYPWLSEAFSQSLQTTLRNLGGAFQSFFNGKAKFPTFHKKGRHDSFTCPQKFRVEEEQCIVFIPKAGEVKIRVNRKFRHKKHIKGEIRSIAISRTCGLWYVSILTERETEDKPVSHKKSVGIDVGIKEFATLSNGKSIENPKYYREYEAQLARVRRGFSRKKKHSKNWYKQLRKVHRIHNKIANSRKDFQHKESTKIVNHNDIICLEDLNIRGMVKNHNLAKSISDAGWGTFTDMLDYKAEWKHGTTVYVPRFYPSSQICSKCGSRQIMPLKLRTYICEDCGAIIDRDYNASINIEQKGLEILHAS